MSIMLAYHYMCWYEYSIPPKMYNIQNIIDNHFAMETISELWAYAVFVKEKQYLGNMPVITWPPVALKLESRMRFLLRTASNNLQKMYNMQGTTKKQR